MSCVAVPRNRCAMSCVAVPRNRCAMSCVAVPRNRCASVNVCVVLCVLVCVGMGGRGGSDGDILNCWERLYGKTAFQVQ